MYESQNGIRWAVIARESMGSNAVSRWSVTASRVNPMKSTPRGGHASSRRHFSKVEPQRDGKEGMTMLLFLGLLSTA